MSSRILRITLVAYLLVVLRITQWPEVADPSALLWLERTLAWWHDHGLPAGIDVPVVEAASNVVMFIPFGVLVPLATPWRRRLVVPAAALFSTLIELSQLIFFADRVATVQDVAMNTAGAAVGVAALSLAGVRPGGRASRLADVTSDAGGTGPEGEGAGPQPPQAADPLARSRTLDLLAESRLQPVEIDLRTVFRAGTGLWLLATVVALVLVALDLVAARTIAVCATGFLLGLLALAWERRRRRRT